MIWLSGPVKSRWALSSRGPSTAVFRPCMEGPQESGSREGRRCHQPPVSLLPHPSFRQRSQHVFVLSGRDASRNVAVALPLAREGPVHGRASLRPPTPPLPFRFRRAESLSDGVPRGHLTGARRNSGSLVLYRAGFFSTRRVKAQVHSEVEDSVYLRHERKGVASEDLKTRMPLPPEDNPTGRSSKSSQFPRKFLEVAV